VGERDDDIPLQVAACREQIAALSAQVATLTEFVSGAHQAVMLGLRYVRDDDERARSALWALRESPAYTLAFDEEEPLVTIIVSTYRNARLLIERSLPSVLGQTYENLEVLVVGDDASPEVVDAMAGVDDQRVRFINLPTRGPYPDQPERAWRVIGTSPFNHALGVARGRWIGNNSDNDALRPTCVEALLRLAREQRSEAVYGQIEQHEPGGTITRLCSFPPTSHHWGTQCTLFHSGLRFMQLQLTDWLFEITNDWALAERMLRIGVRFAMTEETVFDYWPSSLWTDRLSRDYF
jgi:hypothetical protein